MICDLRRERCALAGFAAGCKGMENGVVLGRSELRRLNASEMQVDIGEVPLTCLFVVKLYALDGKRGRPRGGQGRPREQGRS